MFTFDIDDCRAMTIVTTTQWYHLTFVYDFETRTQKIYIEMEMSSVWKISRDDIKVILI